MELFGSLVDVSAILQDRILSLLHILTPQRRIMIALAGVPGAGKSTIASILLERLHEAGVCDVVVAPMVSPTFAYEKINSCRWHLQDGFQYTRANLATFADPVEAFRRWGASFTFNVKSFGEMAYSLRYTPVAEQDDPSRDFWMPSFDHPKQDSIPLDICVPATTRVVVLEGNYLLLNQHPWSQIGRIADERQAFVESPVK
jgi:pantothenate kinase